MKFETYLEQITNQPPPPGWRRGQAAFNLLHQERPDLSEEIHTSCLDPYYDDTRLPQFLRFVEELWDIDSTRKDEQ